MKRKIAFFECEGWEEEYLKSKFPKLFDMYEIDFFEETVDGRDLNDYYAISVFIYSNINKEVIDSLKNCKIIITRSMGYDHIDVSYANKKGMSVYNIYDYGTNTVAEFTILLIQMLLRKVKKIFYDYEMREIINPRAFRGEELEGKTIGIVGTGNIGMRVIELLQPYNVNILAYSRHEKKELKKKYNVEYISFEELLKNSHIVSFHVPLTNETHHMLNKNNVSLLNNAYVVNTARGGVLETEAVIKGLKEGYIKGIAMDVFEGESLERYEIDVLFRAENIKEIKEAFAHQILRHADNVIITPHIAYDTEEALNRIISTTAKILLSSDKTFLEKYEVKEK